MEYLDRFIRRRIVKKHDKRTAAFDPLHCQDQLAYSQPGSFHLPPVVGDFVCPERLTVAEN